MKPLDITIDQLDPSQRDAVELACSARVGIITGGPGTGKSTCLRFALDWLDDHGISYELAAPTGKASKRINETTGRPARTIHRLLEWRGVFRRNHLNPIDTEVVIVDESSMIDVELGAALLSAIDPYVTRLILIGDADQLPPVGPGRLFGDAVQSACFPTVRLSTLHRSALESWIHVNAPRVLRGESLDLGEHRDFAFVPVERSADLLGEVRRVATELRGHRGIDSQVLIPQRTGVAGTLAANAEMQAVFNPRTDDDAPYIRRDGYELRVGDRVIHTRNDYTLGVFNGECGDIVSIDGGRVAVQLDGREVVTYSWDQALALQLAYALTVHRAQGSEFDWAIVLAHSTHTHMLSRQLLYTAITRGKQGVVLIGDAKGIRAALSDARTPKRNTTLIERLAKTLEAA